MSMKKIIVNVVLFVFVCCPLFFVSCGAPGGQRSAGADELAIVAHVTVKPEFKEEMMKAFEAVVEGTRKEPGNISYILYQDANDPLKYTFVEIWESQAAIDAHNNSAHFQEFAKAVEGKADLDVRVMKQKL